MKGQWKHGISTQWNLNIVIKKIETMKIAGKWVELEDILLS